jgi:hypothetical protein
MTLWEILKQTHGVPVSSAMAKLFKAPKSEGTVIIPGALKTTDEEILHTTDNQPLQTKE